jgi:AmmeMemoRadiSam system protein A
VSQRPLPPVETAAFSATLVRLGCSFVTLTHHGQLRGCIGALRPSEALFEDVRHHAVQAALEDFRFAPVTPDEVSALEIEVSVLNDPQPLAFDQPEELLRRLRPEVGDFEAGRAPRHVFAPGVGTFARSRGVFGRAVRKNGRAPRRLAPHEGGSADLPGGEIHRGGVSLSATNCGRGSRMRTVCPEGKVSRVSSAVLTRVSPL